MTDRHCNDSRSECEREGRDAARYPYKRDWDHDDRIREGRHYGSDCDRAYAEGFDREQRHIQAMREEREEEERAEEQRIQHQREQWAREEEWCEAQRAEAQQPEQEQPDPRSEEEAPRV